jgi:hypothetical protein
MYVFLLWLGWLVRLSVLTSVFYRQQHLFTEVTLLVNKVSGRKPDRQSRSVENLWAVDTWNRNSGLLHVLV